VSNSQYEPVRCWSLQHTARFRNPAHRLISRIELELCYHGGQENGKLPVTNEDFCDYGIHHGAIAPAIRESEALGVIKVTERGRGGNAEYRRPNLFRLTHAFTNRSDPPTNEWKRIKTLEEAEAIAFAARRAKDPRAVEFGHRSRRVRKQKTDTGKRALPISDSSVETKKPPIPDSGASSSLRNPVRPSISRGGGPARSIPSEPVKAVRQ
jgi:hypothetical protein